MTSIAKSRDKWQWAAVAQLAVLAHAVLFAVYLTQGQLLYATTTLGVMILVSYYALNLAWQAGVQWPSGRKQE